MRRFRIRRRRALAIALLPAAALTIGSTTSSPAAEQRQAAIDPAKNAVSYGDRVRLRGRFPGAPGEDVTVLYRAAKGERFHKVATSRTNERSRWNARVRPRGTGMWRARLSSAPGTEPSGETLLSEPVEPVVVDSESGAERVAVRSITRVRAKNHTLAGRSVRISGRVRPAGKRAVVVTAGGQRRKTRTDGRGRFDVSWTPRSTGTYRVKARAAGNPRATASRDSGGRVTAYRKAYASWYGPGLYGNRTACGQTLSPSTMGVAHKSMPCGTKLRLRNGNNTVKVRVIDRGPYVGGREFDLTEATRNRLGFGSTGTILTSK
jgi:rare lipoprotein A (peptidoglycan hydrolase)